MVYGAVLNAVALVFTLLGITPLLWMLWAALAEGARDLSVFVPSSSTWLALGRSSLLGLLGSAGAFVLSVPLAFATGRTSTPGRRALGAAALVPLALPPYNLALALDGWLPGNPLVASALVLSLALYPIPYVFLRAALSGVDASLEEAALVTRGGRATLLHVTWPLVRPWGVAAAGIVFLLGLGEFGAPAYLGLPVYSGQIMMHFAASYAPARAAVAALPLFVAVLLLLAWESAALRRVPLFAGQMRPGVTFELGRARVPLLLICLGILLASPGLPLLLTVLAIDGRGISKALPLVVRPALNSLLVATLGCLLALVVALAAALLTRRGIRIYRWVSLTFFVIPGAVLGIGLIVLWNRPMLPPLYGSTGLLVVAVALRYTALAERAIDSGLSRVPLAQEEVARLSGRPPWAIARHILLPQIVAALLAGAVAFLLFALRDLDTVVTIYPPGGETLAVNLYIVLANAPRGLQATLSLAQMALTLPVVALLALVVRRCRWLL